MLWSQLAVERLVRTVRSPLHRERKADLMKSLLIKRTGEELPSTFDVRPFLNQPEALRVV